MHRAVFAIAIIAALAALFLPPALPWPAGSVALAQSIESIPIRPIPQDRLGEATEVPTALPGPGSSDPTDGDERGDPTPLNVDCETAIAETAARTRVSEGLLLAIARLESGLERWAVTAAGETEIFDARDKALAALQAHVEAGATPIRIGCMGIDVAGDASPFPRREAGFDSRLNVETAAARLLRLQRRSGTWAAAIGGFHGDEDPGRQLYYRCRVLQELARLRGQQPQICEEPGESAEALAAAPNPGPRVVPLDGGLRALPRADGDGPLIVRGLEGMRELGRGRAPAAGPAAPTAPPGDARVEIFRSRPSVAGTAADPPAGPSGHGSSAVTPRDSGGGTRVQHVTGTEASGTVVREVR
ncbi:MAG: hypothetical protein GVY13_16775 [Alphaproteobacteria bacterium]|jgi:hypothetical protein|nr:hypothetical protein [Alphaproteobacteria bacterium]